MIFVYDPLDKPVIFDDVLAAVQADYAQCEVLVNRDTIFAQRYVYQSLSCNREYQPINYDNGIKIVDRFGDYNVDSESIRVVTGWEVADEAQLDQYNCVHPAAHERAARTSARRTGIYMTTYSNGMWRR